VLAAAGLKRLGLAARSERCSSPSRACPRLGEGALVIECRRTKASCGSDWLLSGTSRHRLRTRRACAEPRIVGDCQLPLAAYAVANGAEIRLRGLVAMPDGSKVVRAELSGTIATRKNWADARGKTAALGADRFSPSVMIADRSRAAVSWSLAAEHALALASESAPQVQTRSSFHIEILPPENAAAVSSLVARLDGFQLAVSSVRRGDAGARDGHGEPEMAEGHACGGCRIGTASALEERGFRAVIAPSGEADSEALAELPELQDLKGRSVVIFAAGGREWLRTRLEARGARVEYAECYRRARPDADAGGLSPAAERRNRSGLDYQREGWGTSLKCWALPQGILARDPVFVRIRGSRLPAQARRAGDRCDRARRCRTVAEMGFFAKV